MLFDIKKLFYSYKEPVKRELVFDFTDESFQEYKIDSPVAVSFGATIEHELLTITLSFQVIAHMECARCLDAITKEFSVDRTYLIRENEWEAEDYELPIDENGRLDMKELTFTEIILEIPSVLLCSDDCAGLCPVCGGRKPCSCKHETTDTTDQRLSILQQLLN